MLLESSDLSPEDAARLSSCGVAGMAYPLLAAGNAELSRLRLVRGRYKRTARRMRQAIAKLVLAASLLGTPFLGDAAAAPPVFVSGFDPFGLTDVQGDYDSSYPALVDLDGDGDLDLVQGSDYVDVGFCENTGTPSAPAFAEAVALDVPTVDGAQAFAFGDLDGDGDLDALVRVDVPGPGTLEDTGFLRNTGTASAPAFAPPVAKAFGLVSVDGPRHALADIDGDGDLDAFIGDYTGNTRFQRNTGTPTAPAFAPSVTNPFGLSDVGNYASPALLDIDGDGDLDAFVSQRFFQNTGSPTVPAFAPAVPDYFGRLPSFAGPLTTGDLDADGDLDVVAGRSDHTLFLENTGSATAPAFDAAFLHAFGLNRAGTAPAPALADLDGDGDLDALVGEYYGNLFFLENTGTATAPAFAARRRNPFGLSQLGYESTPTLADLDGDGDFDVLAGDEDENLYFFWNTGTPTAPAFALPVTNPFGLTPTGKYSAATTGDLDGDGDLDLVVGAQHGNISVFENTGTVTAPAFAAPATNPFGLTMVVGESAPAMADVDGDGDLDVFVGSYSGSLSFFENTGTPTTPSFRAPVVTPFGLPSVYGESMPAPVDIDGDGDVDLVLGSYGFGVLFFENVAIDVPTTSTTTTPSVSTTSTTRPSTDPASIAGVVLAEQASGSPVPVAGALVEVCRQVCQVLVSGGGGAFAATDLPAGSYTLRAFPPELSSLLPAERGPVQLAPGQAAAGQDLLLRIPRPPTPAAGLVDADPGPGGLPTVYWSDPLDLRATGCAGGTATYEVRHEGALLRSGTMVESASGAYAATIPPLRPALGVAEVLVRIACPGGAEQRIAFDVYIDPSGVVVDQTGAPVVGATVTLLRAEQPSGPFDVVADGSPVMSPANRRNPDQTRSGGRFGWDVLAGFYVVRAARDGCTAPDGAPAVATPVLTVPPPVTDLVLELYCPVPVTPAVEDCANCADDDGDGQVDIEDPDCCTGGSSALALTRATLTPRKHGSSAVVLVGSAPWVFERPPALVDVLVQIRSEDGDAPAVCAVLPASAFQRSKKGLRLRRGAANAAGLSQVVLRANATGTVALRMTGKRSTVPVPEPGTLRIAGAIRDAAGNLQCSGARVDLRAGKKGAVRYP